jgi:antirestriction protein ArdC
MSKVYEIITDKFIAELKKGVVPWRKPWKCSGLPMNLISKKPYNGINLLLLMMSGFASPYWLTFNQAKQKGGSVKKGEKSTLISFWKITKGKDGGKDRFMLRYYRVFNVEQCEGIEVPTEKELDFVTNDKAQAIIDNFEDCPEIKFGGDRACWSPSLDVVNTPRPEDFKSPEYYYAVNYHELIHSTGHESRTGRLANYNSVFGSESYAFEELVAELGAAFLCHDADIDLSKVFDNSAAYVAGWLKRLQNDPKLIVKAAKASQEAANYIRGVKVETATTNKELTTSE